MGEMIFRFLIGGAVVSAFAVLSEVFRPKSFAGLFSAAPSVALATLGITIAHHGKWFAATEARSMLFGVAAFFCYAAAAAFVMVRFKTGALKATVALIPVWFGVSFGLWWVLAR